VSLSLRDKVPQSAGGARVANVSACPMTLGKVENSILSSFLLNNYDFSFDSYYSYADAWGHI